MKKFDIETYTARRQRELGGEVAPLGPRCPIADAYTSQRIRELHGEAVYWDTEEQRVTTYCSGWIEEHKLDTPLSDRKLLLDNRRLGSYTLGTIGERDGET